MKLIVSAAIVTASVISIAFFLIYKKANVASENEVKKWIAGGAMIVDVRTPEEFKIAKYDGAINIPLAEIEKKIHLFGKKNGKIIVYCRTGNRSGKAKKILESHGFTNILNGGGLNDMPK